MRFGYCHVVNNDYPSGWGMYAIGGSEDPTFLSEGNRFVASDSKEVRLTFKLHNLAGSVHIAVLVLLLLVVVSTLLWYHFNTGGREWMLEVIPLIRPCEDVSSCGKFLGSVIV